MTDNTASNNSAYIPYIDALKTMHELLHSDNNNTRFMAADYLISFYNNNCLANGDEARSALEAVSESRSASED